MPHEGEATSVGGFFALAPLLLFAVFVAAAFEQILVPASPSMAQLSAAPRSASHRADHLFHRRQCRAADRSRARRRTVRLACGPCCSARWLRWPAACSLPLIFDAWLIWPLVFVWGGVSFGIYTLSLIQLGERFNRPVP